MAETAAKTTRPRKTAAKSTATKSGATETAVATRSNRDEAKFPTASRRNSSS